MKRLWEKIYHHKYIPSNIFSHPSTEKREAKLIKLNVHIKDRDGDLTLVFA